MKDQPLLKNRKFAELCVFLAKLSECYKTDLGFLQDYIQEFLENYQLQMNPYLRMKMVMSYIIMRNKNLILPIKSITFLLSLFNCQDKELRKVLASHIINDIKRMNQHHKNQAINKQVQNYIFEILKKNSDNLAKRAIQIMIALYKKNIWNDDKTVNIIAQGCFNDYYKIKLIACYFMIETTQLEDMEDSSDEEDDKGQPNIYDKKASKKTKAKEARLLKDKKKALKKHQKKLQRKLKQNFFPIDLIYNPQDFCEKLYQILQKSNEKFQVKLALMSVISRMMGRHKLILLSFYSYIQKYLTPNQKEIVKLLAYLAESMHDQVHPEDFKPTLAHLIENFVNDRCSEYTMTVGLNTIREITQKNPQLIDEFHVNYLAGFYNYKNRNVSKAAKALINSFRELNPQLLEKKFRGKHGASDDADKLAQDQELHFKQDIVNTTIDGVDLLDKGGDVPLHWDRILTDDDFKKIKYMKKKLQEEQEEKQRQMLLANQRGADLADDDEDDQSEASDGSWADEEVDEEVDEDDEDELEEEEDQEEPLAGKKKKYNAPPVQPPAAAGWPG